MSTPHAEEIRWLVDQSMLEEARRLAAQHSGQGAMWRYPYAQARPRDASALASVWFTAYPPAIITRPGESVIKTLGDPQLWQALSAIGIEAIHTGPTKLSGGLDGRRLTPSVDGNFDRIGLTLDPQLGTVDEFVALGAAAAAHGAIVIDDIIPGHTGKGADFRLAERNYGDYPGIYHMVEILPADWSLLPDIAPGKDSANLSPETEEILRSRGYIVGRLERVIFFEPGVKETNWSATAMVPGVDGVARRWVYLHYFKEGQPTLNWLDPSFAAARLVIGDAIHSLTQLGAAMLRLDANGFLGIETREGGPAWSEGHPLSVTANQLIAGMVRKLGGFTFQELNLTVDDIAAMANGAADLSYDFITRPAYHHALVTGDVEFLRLMLRTVHAYGIDPAALVHALQNHDELTLELVHFWTRHKDDVVTFAGASMTGGALRDHIRREMYHRLTGDAAPYNLRFVTNGVACTTVSVIAAALGLDDLTRLSPDDIDQIRRGHLLLVMYNALQPGVFALSGWDLVGALPLPRAEVESLLADGDTRWINRGAYDLLGFDDRATTAASGLPRATALYGALDAQLADPRSFAAALQRILAVRKQGRIFAARQIAIPETTNPALLVMVHELPDGLGRQVTALNFGRTPLSEELQVDGLTPGIVVNMLDGQPVGVVTSRGALRLTLDGLAGCSCLVKPDRPA